MESVSQLLAETSDEWTEDEVFGSSIAALLLLFDGNVDKAIDEVKRVSALLECDRTRHHCSDRDLDDDIDDSLDDSLDDNLDDSLDDNVSMVSVWTESGIKECQLYGQLSKCDHKIEAKIPFVCLERLKVKREKQREVEVMAQFVHPQHLFSLPTIAGVDWKGRHTREGFRKAKKSINK